jgi:hypothetical protein
LRRKLVPPSIGVADFVADFWAFWVVYSIAEHKLMDALLAGARAAHDIAHERGLDEDAVYRLLRAGSTLDLVKEHDEKCFSLLPLGDALCDRPGSTFRAFIVYMGRHGSKNWQSLHDSVRSGKTAIELQTGKRLWERLADEPEMARDFDDAMTGVSSLSVEPILAAYDFGAFDKIVDVGGGHGRLLAGILKTAPGATGVLFDQPQVVAGAAQMMTENGVADRCEVVGGNFFESIPAGADAYVLKSVIHDWQDGDALAILKQVRKAIGPDGVLLVIDTVVPEPGVKHFAKLLDLEMLVTAGGRERTRDEHARLFQRAGFRLNRIVPTAAPLSIIEAKPG